MKVKEVVDMISPYEKVGFYDSQGYIGTWKDKTCIPQELFDANVEHIFSGHFQGGTKVCLQISKNTLDVYKAIGLQCGSCEPMTETLRIELRHNPSELVELLEEQYKSGEISPIVISESLITLFRMLGEKNRPQS